MSIYGKNEYILTAQEQLWYFEVGTRESRRGYHRGDEAGEQIVNCGFRSGKDVCSTRSYRAYLNSICTFNNENTDWAWTKKERPSSRLPWAT
jgi:hypothetical protein